MEKYDVAVVGGGVVGGLILRELSRYRLRVCLLEKERDVATGASKANTGIVHGGFDALPHTNKAKYNLLGAALMPQTAKELGVNYKNNGSMVVAFSEEEVEGLHVLYRRGIENGVQGLKILSAAQTLALEPNLRKEVKGALLCESAGIVCPYTLTVAAIGNGMDNGGELFLDFEVEKIEGELLTAKDGRQIRADIVVNAAGAYADALARAAGDTSFTVGARKGEYLLLDKVEKLFSHTLFFCPSKQSKGIVVTHTVDGNLLLGPTASEIEDKGDKSTTTQGLAFVREKAAQMSEKIPFGDTITAFTGVRAFSDRHDFILEWSKVKENVLHVAGIESPGLTAAPALAKEAVRLIGEKKKLIEKADFSPYRKSYAFFQELSKEEKNKLIAKDSNYGKIVCRCEGITLGEILYALRENPKATTLDGIKRRTRAGMGRCQGGFCQPSVLELIANELHIPLEEVEKDAKGSKILTGRTKE